MTAFAAIYLTGVIVGLFAVDGPLTTRIGLALVWPLGPLAFVLTIAMLIVVAAIAFPAFGVALVALIAAAWYLLM